MKKAMVIGASGGMGYALVNELVNRGIQVVAFARGKEKLDKLFGTIDRIEIHSGNAEVKEHLIEAGKGCDVIFHAMNIPYQDWKDKLAVIMENVIMAAKKITPSLRWWIIFILMEKVEAIN
ncbi:SDR family NAD(P)-dependent oxidoreductase [Rossellomorea aquimaris]|uniref:SDR family NAD(P)-dependent oxidoreductase n=1 Tax=Rossellomorea aquimaris TaxID=189382 RepID=UPI000A519D02|nr:SDR family NAD(P)-dependent oxidoreductase [Rossellomorea aquimaris]